MILDIEGDSLTPTKIYCLAYYDEVTGEEDVLTDYEDMRRLLRDKNRLIGHNIIRFDIPVLERILGIDLSNKEKIDTLGLSWYLYNDRTKHGLDSFTTEFGLEKPKIADWENASIESLKHRCMSDVKLNMALYFKEVEYLNKLYNNKTKSILNYIAFKLDCAREQEEIKWKLDVEKVKSNLAYFESEANRRLDALRQIMPKVTKYKSISKPDKLYKKDGSLTVQATNWFDLLYEQGLEQDHEDPINIIVSEVDGNPKSHTQMKDWLFSLGWIPDYFKKNEKGEDIPQISNAEKQVCNSIKLLYEIEPGLENLESLSVINHRIGVLEGFLENEEDGYLRAEISGFTNTLRNKHKTIRFIVVYK